MDQQATRETLIAQAVKRQLLLTNKTEGFLVIVETVEHGQLLRWVDSDGHYDSGCGLTAILGPFEDRKVAEDEAQHQIEQANCSGETVHVSVIASEEYLLA